MVKKELLTTKENIPINYQDIVELSGYIFVVLDRTGKVVKINKKGCDLLGCPATKVLGREWFSDFLPKNTGPEIKALFKKLVAGEEKVNEFHENFIRTCAGKQRLISWHNLVMHNKAGKFLYSVSIGEDITEQRQEHLKLIQSENDYRLIFETAANLITSVNGQGIIVDCNDQIKEFLGYEKAEIIGQSMKKIIQKDFWQAAERSLAEILAVGRTFNKHYQMVKKDGSLIDVNINSSAIKDASGRPERTICIIENVTDRAQAETRLKQLAEFNQKIIDHSPFGIFILNQAGTVEYANQAMVDISATPKEKMIGFSLVTSPTYKKIGMDALIKKAIAEKKPFKTEIIKYRSLFGNKESYRIFSGIPLLEANGNFSKLLLAIDDQTEITKKSEELKSFNQLMVGREIKMIELKAEITRLKELLSKNNK